MTAVVAGHANRWTLPHSEAMSALDVKTTRLMVALMASPNVREAWINRGTAQRPRYFWDPALLSSWFFEACKWRGAVVEERSGSSAGSRPSRGRSGAVAASSPLPTPMRSSATPSGRARPAGSTGSLLVMRKVPRS